MNTGTKTTDPGKPVSCFSCHAPAHPVSGETETDRLRRKFLEEHRFFICDPCLARVEKAAEGKYGWTPGGKEAP